MFSGRTAWQDISAGRRDREDGIDMKRLEYGGNHKLNHKMQIDATGAFWPIKRPENDL